MDINNLTADKLLEMAKQSGDKERWANRKELTALLQAGAIPVRLNSKQIGGSYDHEARYKGQRFVHDSTEPVDFSGIDIAKPEEPKGHSLGLPLGFYQLR